MGCDWKSSRPKSLSYRQSPGKRNNPRMSFVKINFASGEVRLHARQPVRRPVRDPATSDAASSGSIRVNSIERLANWLLSPRRWLEQRTIMSEETERRRYDVPAGKRQTWTEPRRGSRI